MIITKGKPASQRKYLVSWDGKDNGVMMSFVLFSPFLSFFLSLSLFSPF